jgi:hypothetical protein
MNRRWRVVLLRSKGEILGTVEALDAASAEAAAAVLFALDEIQRNRVIGAGACLTAARRATRGAANGASTRERRLAGRAERTASLAAKRKYLAERNKSEGRGSATKRHDNDFAQIPFRGPMHPVGRNDRGHRDALLLPPTRQRRIDLRR